MKDIRFTQYIMNGRRGKPEKMHLSRMWGVGDVFMRNKQNYRVVSVAVEGKTQVVTIEVVTIEEASHD